MRHITKPKKSKGVDLSKVDKHGMVPINMPEPYVHEGGLELPNKSGPLIPTKTNPKFSPLDNFISEGLQLSYIMQKFHLNTRSYAKHKALDTFYKEFPLLMDRLCEVHICDTGTEIECYSKAYYDSPIEVIDYICGFVDSYHDGRRCIDNILDDIDEFCMSIKYKLERLR